MFLIPNTPSDAMATAHADSRYSTRGTKSDDDDDDALGDDGGNDGTRDSTSRNGKSGTIMVTSSFDSPHRRFCCWAAADAFVGAAGRVSPNRSESTAVRRRGGGRTPPKETAASRVSLRRGGRADGGGRPSSSSKPRANDDDDEDEDEDAAINITNKKVDNDEERQPRGLSRDAGFGGESGSSGSATQRPRRGASASPSTSRTSTARPMGVGTIRMRGGENPMRRVGRLRRRRRWGMHNN